MMNRNFNNELQQLQMELRAQNFDVIRFSTYRIACKLRFIQKKFNFHLLDLLNVIESLRESLSSLSSQHVTSINCPLLSITHLNTFLTSIYTNLNKRLPLSQQIQHIDNCIHSAIAWFIYVFNPNNSFIRFNSFRVVLILLCNGKLIDKMRHLFTSYLSPSSSHTLTYHQIDELLHEILALPYALQEISYSTYRKNYAQSIFSHLSSPITLNCFLDLLIYNNTTPNCLQWLIIFHRLISVENVIHRTKCSACNRPSFSGFRYKCQQCHHRTYQLCQDCFWRGRTSDQHLSTHEMKEYTYFISPNKDFRHSIRKSFQCVPKTDKRYQLISPLTIDQEQKSSPHPIQIDIPKFKPSEIPSANQQRNADKKLMISKLEAENRRIHHEINTLRRQLQYHAYSDTDIFSPIDRYYTQRRACSVETTNKISYFENVLDELLTRKHQLEYQREELISHLNNNRNRTVYYSPSFQQRSNISSPHRHSRIKSHYSSNRSYSTPSTPIHHLHQAADSLTSAMSSLIQQLNTSNEHIPVLKSYYQTDDESFLTSDDELYYEQ